jgi:Grx4 family monothiol glutaredoxin
VEATGAIPPGNAPGETSWAQRRARAAKPEIRLTPGKGLADLACPVTDLVDAVVKANRVVAFVKGTRTAPQCGFSHKVLTMLQEVAGADFEVVNVLDDLYNPGLREAIKEYSQWPTIPQVYVGGEFVGGADILEQMHGSGELRALLAATPRG